MSWHKEQCYIAIMAGTLTLNTLRKNYNKAAIWTNDIGVMGALSDTRREGYDGLITQTGIFLFLMTFISCKKLWSDCAVCPVY